MADFNALETLINAYIKKNGVQAITGNILNGVLRGMVSALGKGYTIIGVASPSTDPGTMTGPCAYYASQAGTYTNFGGLVVNDGDVAMLIYDEQNWHKEVMFSLAAEASVDANVGTPWVNASFENGMLTFTFGNMKGNPGDAAGFGTVNATVDSNIGTPGVSVQTSGPDTAKNMTFQFTNLKGETGVTSVVVTVDNTSGTPACAVSLNNQELHLDFTGLKGAQGNPGSSVDYPFTLVNNLTTNDPDQALTAAMGYQLEGEISQLEAKLGTSETVNGMQLGTEGTGRINADGSRTWNNGYKYRDIPNNGYTRVTGHGSTYKNLIYLAFYNSATPGSSSLISSLTAGTSNVDINFDELVPPGTVTITVGWSLTSPATTAAITLCKIVDRLDNIEDRLDALEDVTEDLPDLEETADDLFTKTHFVTKTEDDFTLAGFYNSENTNLTDQYHYVSLPLINVREGQKIYWHGWATGESFKTSQAICCYDNDGLPYNGTNARIDFDELATMDYVNGEFSFIVPTNCSQVGISFTFYSYPVPDGAYIQIGDNEYALTDTAIDLINGAIGANEVTGDKSAKYYLKGNSNIVYSPSKKLGIIAAGQSNIAGRNSYSDLPAGFVNPNDKVRFCDNTNGTFADFEVVDGGAGNDWSFDAIVYDLLTKAAYGNQSEIYVMKKAMGGTSIDKDGATNYHWTADYEYLSSETYSLLRAFEKTIRKGEETQGANFEIKAFLWHQGEGDADTQAVANRYYDNLKNMLSYVRGVVGNPRLDFFCGNLSTHNVSNPYVSVINAAYAKLASEDPYFHCVDMRNATLEDSWHFDYEWSIYFGQKVYDLMIDAGIITGTKINPSEPS